MCAIRTENKTAASLCVFNSKLVSLSWGCPAGGSTDLPETEILFAGSFFFFSDVYIHII